MKPSVNRVLCVNASDQINLQDSSSTQVETDLRLLELAFRERLLAIGGNAVILESLVTAAEGYGYQGTAEKAAETLIGSGRFSIAPGPSGRSIVWQSDPGVPRSETGK
jgi:hypothetical protein